MTPADIAGWAGAALLLLAYARTATGRTTTRGLDYYTYNLLGSAGLAIVAAARRLAVRSAQQHLARHLHRHLAPPA